MIRSSGRSSAFAILLPALLAVTLTLACASDDEPPLAVGFYAEVAVDVEPQPDGLPDRFGFAERQTVIRWWYAPDPSRWRWEIKTMGSIIDDGAALTVVNGNDAWASDDRSNSYWRRTLVVVPAGVTLLPTFNALVGPVKAKTIDGLIDQWRERGDYSEASLVGEATLLGRLTRIVELRPSTGGVARAFVDPERMFIMRWVFDAEDDGQSYCSEVTALDYDTEIDESRFTFDAPPGAREVEARDVQSCHGSSGPVGGAAFPAEPGFLRPAYVPARYHSTASGSESSASGDCGPISVWALAEAPDGSYILLRQRFRSGGVPRAVRSWQPADANLDEAYTVSENGVLRLLWRDGDVVALLETDAVSFDELLRIAESSTLVPHSRR